MQYAQLFKTKNTKKMTGNWLINYLNNQQFGFSETTLKNLTLQITKHRAIAIYYSFLRDEYCSITAFKSSNIQL